MAKPRHMELPQSEVEEPKAGLYYTVGVLMLATTFIYADQNLLAPNLSVIASEFGFSPAERDWKLGGQIALAFFVAGAPAAILIGILADRMSRRALFLAIVLIGEVPVLLTYWVTAYWQLFMTRVVTGISIGGAMPLVFSLLGDMFPVSKRALIASLFGVSAGVGSAAGQLLAGSVGESQGWRWPFVIIAIPSLFLGFLVFFTTQDPVRGSQEQSLQGQAHLHQHTIDMEKLRSIFKIRTNLLAFLQGLPGCIPWGVVFAFLNDYLSEEKNLSVLEATLVVTFFGVGSVIGGIVGGFIGQRIYNHNPKGVAYFMAASTAGGVVPTLMIINSDYSHKELLWGKVVLSFLCGGLVSCTGPNIRALLINVNTPETRGSAFSIFSLSDDLGKGLGPLFASSLILGVGRQRAFNIAVMAWVVCAVVLFCISFTLEHDEAQMQDLLQSRVIGIEELSRSSTSTEIELDLSDDRFIVDRSTSTDVSRRLEWDVISNRDTTNV